MSGLRGWMVVLGVLGGPVLADDHVPPDPPRHVLHDMSDSDMVNMMQMNDTSRFGRLLLDRLEWRDSGGHSGGAWDAQGWYGGDYDKLWIKTEGGRSQGVTQDARADVLWDRIVSRWWDAQLGVRQDFGVGPARTWLAAGVQGLMPGWLETQATLYAGEEGRVAARFEVADDLRLTQRWTLQPRVELNAYSKSDPQRLLGSGVSDLDLSLRLRYEIRRELAPYLGVVWSKSFGGTADLLRAARLDVNDVEVTVGVRVWM